jgi:hypothetical protein
MKTLDLDLTRLRAAAPMFAPMAIALVGWIALVAPVSSRNVGDARDLDLLRQRLAAARATLHEPIGAAPKGDAVDAFRRAMSAGDATPALLEQLARRASEALAGDLRIETGDRVSLSGGSAAGPQVANLPQPDPRLALFETPLTLSPITMSFDAAYPDLGAFLWSLRGLATVVEIRSLELKPSPPSEQVTEHVTMTLFAYARPAEASVHLAAAEPVPAVIEASAPGAGR